jgi:hypothetical protein
LPVNGKPVIDDRALNKLLLAGRIYPLPVEFGFPLTNTQPEASSAGQLHARASRLPMITN